MPSDPVIRTIFVEALDQPTAEARALFLTKACGADEALRQRVEALLQAHDEAGSFLADSSKRGQVPEIASKPPSSVSEAAGDRIGRYKLLQQIGEGGCGVVYMAEQEEPVRRRVALKVIKLGMDTKQVIARFEAERQALALMDHPNIAKVLDAGATEAGRPYFVMELIRGVKITDFCDENKLSTEERLKLFSQVCKAVQHAHQKGVIHRDIKPSNILVTINDNVPVPMVIDFGIAKATQGRLTDQTLFTAFEQFIGTPAYMSPEQAVMTSVDIDTRSDIYSLGVLLYELLTGRPPFDQKQLLSAGLDEMRRTIREKEPPRPSTCLSTMAAEALTVTAKHRDTEPPKLISTIRGDLDWIVMRCLEKDRSRRYETANGLAADIQRHIKNETVSARPPGRAYQLQKLVKRNRLAFGAVAAVFAALIAGLAVSSWMFLQEKMARQRAVVAENKALVEAARSDQVAKFMKGMLSGVEPGVARGRDTALLREVLSQTDQRLSKDLSEQPAVEADLRETLGLVYRDLGAYTNAVAMFERALLLYRQLHGENDRHAVSTLNGLGQVYHRMGKADAAIATYREALAILAKLPHDDALLRADVLNNLGSILRHEGKTDEAEAALREALAIRRKLLPAVHLDTAASLGDLGLLLAAQGKTAEALIVRREEVEIRRALQGSDHFELADALRDYGGTLAALKRYAEAETNLLEALAIDRKVFTDHRETVLTLNQLGTFYVQQNRLAEAEEMLGQAVVMERKLFDDGSTLNTLEKLADVLWRENKLPEAEVALRDLLRMRQAQGLSPSTLDRLVEVLLRQEKFADAEASLREVVRLHQAQIKNGHAESIEPMVAAVDKLALVLARQKKQDEAIRVSREAVAALKQLPASNQIAAADSLEKWGRKAVATHLEQSDVFLRGAVEIRKACVGNAHGSVVQTLDALSHAVNMQGHSVEAEAIAREAIAIGQTASNVPPGELGVAFQRLGGALGYQHRFPEAEAALRESIEIHRHSGATNRTDLSWSIWNLAQTLFDLNKAAEAEPLVHEAADMGNSGAQYTLGFAYENGFNETKDYSEALKWYRKAADQNRYVNYCTSAMYRLGVMYYRGKGVATNYATAVDWFKKSADRGENMARYQLGQIYSVGGIGVEKDPTQSAKWYRLAAENDHGFAMYKLARLYDAGIGVEKNPAEAAKWRDKLINLNDPGALNELAWYLATGDEKFRDGRLAIQLAEKAVATTERKNHQYLDTLAATYAEAGEFEKASATQEEAIALFRTPEDKRNMDSYSARLKLYQSRQPYRE